MLQRVAMGSDGAMPTRHILTDRQTNVWKFARGPLPDKIPVREIGDDWIVIGIA